MRLPILLFIAAAAAAAPGARAQERRLITMREAVADSSLSVSMPDYFWSDSSSELYHVDSEALWAEDPATGRSRRVLSVSDIETATGMRVASVRDMSVSDGCLVLRTSGRHAAVSLSTGELSYSVDVSQASCAVTLPDGTSFQAVGNDLVMLSPDGAHTAITDNGPDGPVSGSVVSREEFGIDGGIFPSPDGARVAFYTKDESAVTRFPLLDVRSRTGTLVSVPYPMNGMASERVTLSVYDIASGVTVPLRIDDFTDERYLTCVTWSPDAQRIYVQVLDRSQRHMRLNCYDASTGLLISNVLSEDSDTYVEPMHPLRFLDGGDGRFIYTTDNRDGYSSLYLYDPADSSLRRLTDVDADVEFLCQSGRWLWYYSFEVSPVERHVFRMDMRNAAVQRMTPEEGWHTVSVSPDGKWLTDSWSSLTVPGVTRVASSDTRRSRELVRAADPTAHLSFTPIRMGTVRSADGRYDNWYRLIMPIDFDPSKKYPLILYVYGGPHSQMVTDTFQASLRRWEMYMAQRGYAVLVMDNRGTSNRGAAYARSTYSMLGRCEMEDQVAGVRWLVSQGWIDTGRIGVHGWSYGGFMTISLMTHYPEIFKVGVAGGPVIDWKWYEVMYGERYMGTQETNPEGFAATSLIPRAADLKGKLLICQGAMDRTVVWQHSLSFVNACIASGVQLDYFPYPSHEHNVSGTDRVHLMDKVTDYFDTFLR